MSSSISLWTRRLRSALLSTTWLIVVMIVLELAFALGLLLSDRELNPLVNVWLAIATQWVPVAIFWLVAARTRFARAEVMLAAVAVTLSAVGDTYYSLAMDSEGQLAFPSPADIGYLLFYPLMIAALIALARRQAQRSLLGVVILDSTVAALGAASVLAVMLGPVFAAAIDPDSWQSSAVSVAYPLLDLVLIATIVGIAASPAVDIGPRWTFLVLGLLIFTAGDFAYAFLEHEGAYVAGTPLDAVWALGLAFIAWWVDGIGKSVDDESHRRTHRFVVPLPAIAVVAGIGVLVYATQVSVSPVALVLATGSVGLAALPVMVRQAMLNRLVAGQAQVVQQLEDLDRSKSELMATVNHELRTPITSIRGYLELVADGDGGEIPDEAKKMLAVVNHNAKRLEVLVEDMLLMSRPAESMLGEREPVELLPLVAAVVESLYPVATARTVQLSVEADAGVAPVRGDRAQLERVFTNIVENAVKFTQPGGSVRVVIEAESGLGEPSVVVSTIDTGMGIAETELPLLFTRFFRASNAKLEAVRGSGLGLSIARSLVHAHGGDVTVASALGEGTTVRVQLPTVDEL